jgi:hypothetical protein
MDNRHLALELASCESEEEVISLLKAEDLWTDSSRWRNFGDVENNWSTIGNQQSDADAALVEKIVNSIDALLMKECLIRGISPSSDKAPRSIAEALERFFGITGGKIQNLTESERTRLAQKNIILAATGKKGIPNFTIVDRGEGQTPASMPDTILSINKSNKLKVPFVQGKFNMGGTGVISFCGKENFQLIISRRCPQIDESVDSTHNLWGFTIIRRERPSTSSGYRSSRYTYLVDDNKDIMSFESDSMPIIPTSNGQNDDMEYGMYCKLFEYELPSSRMGSNINMALFYRLSMLLPNLAYPVYMDECRDYRAHSLFRTLSGLNVRLSDQLGKDDSNIEAMLPVSFTIDGQKVGASVYVFKSKTKTGTKLDMSQYRGNEGVLLTQNGQTHGSYDKRFYTRNSVGLSYLSDSLLTIVDCTAIDEATREELFMNSRDRIRGSNFAKKLESNLEEFLKGHETLKQIQAKRREEAISDKLDDEKPLEDILSNVFKSSNVLSKLFILGDRLKNPTNLGRATESEKFEGKYNPTYFTIVRSGRDTGVSYIKEAQLGRKFRIRFKTDACNDFFSREKYPGTYELIRDDGPCEDHFMNLRNGIATLNVELPAQAKEGDSYTYVISIVDTNIDKTFENNFIISVVANQDIGGGRGERTPPDGENKDGKSITPAGIKLPNVREITHSDWEMVNFDRESALAVLSAEEGVYDFYVNMDNIHLQTEIKPIAKDENKMKLLKARYKYGMVLIGLSILGYVKNYENLDNGEEDKIDDPETTIRLVTKMVSPIILPMIDVLGDDLGL